MDFDAFIKLVKEQQGIDLSEVLTTADQIKRPEKALEDQAIIDFNKRNPMAGGGMLVQPGFGGTRQGYAKSKKKISNTEGLENLNKQDKITNKNVQNWTTKWIKQNSKNYNVRQFDLFKKDMAKAWSEEIKNKKKYNPFRLNITTSEGLPNARGLNINNVTTPIRKDPTLGFEKIFYDQMFKNKDFKKKVIEYLDFVNIDKRFGSVRDDLVAQGKIATDDDGKAFFKKSSGSKKAYLDYAKFIDENVVYFFGDVLNSRRLYNNNPASLNIYSIIEKNTPPEKIQKYRKKLATSYSSWMNNLKEVADLAGMDFNKVLEMQYNESAKMKKLFNVSELPFDFQYAQDHLFGLAEAKELGDSKIAKQTLKNLVATTKAQNAYLGTKGFTQKRTKLIRNFKNASLENKANIVNQLNTLAEEYVPGRLQYNVKKDGSLKITNLRPETTFRERAISYKNLAKNFPVAVKKQFALLGGENCGRGFKNQGGRVGLQDGTPDVNVCFGKAIERIRKGGVDFTKAESVNFNKLTKSLRAIGASNIMKFGVIPEALFEGALIADKMASEGDSFAQGLRNSYLAIPFQAMGIAKTYEEGRRDEVLAAAPESQRGQVQDVFNMQDSLNKKNQLRQEMFNLEKQKQQTDTISDGSFGYVGDTQDLDNRILKRRQELEGLYDDPRSKLGKVSRDEKLLTGSPLDLNIKDQLTMDAYNQAVEKSDADRASNILFAPGTGLEDVQIKKRMSELPVTPEYAKEQLQATGDYFGRGYTPLALNKVFTLLGRENPRFGLDETGKYSEEKGLNDYMNYLRTLNFAENFRDEKAGGGIAKMAGDRSGAMLESMNPDSQGLSGLLKRGIKT
jgi:hypothetical protein